MSYVTCGWFAYRAREYNYILPDLTKISNVLFLLKASVAPCGDTASQEVPQHHSQRTENTKTEGRNKSNRNREIEDNEEKYGGKVKG